MAVEMPVIQRTYVAGADLSAKQYYFVKFNGTVGPTGQPEVVVCSALTDQPCGVLQNDPLQGQEASVMILGLTKISADAALNTIGAAIGTSADGQADAKTIGTDTTEFVCGYLDRKASAGNVIGSAFINCINPPRAV
jgi:hypothetical protein